MNDTWRPTLLNKLQACVAQQHRFLSYEVPGMIDLADVSRELSACLRPLQQDRALNNGGWQVERPMLLRLVFSIRPCSPLKWLAAQALSQRTYWQDREGARQSAGVGFCDTLQATSAQEWHEAFATLQERLTGAPSDARYFGGMRFAPHEPPDRLWRPFGVSLWVLPTIQLVQCGDKHTCHVHIKLTPDTSLTQSITAMLNWLQEVVWEQKTLPRPRLPLSEQDEPNETGWHEAIHKAQEAFATTPLEKVVLAKAVHWQHKHPQDPMAWLQALQERAHDTYVFLFQLDHQRAFLGATPERLYKRERGILFSEALAGTRPRGDTPAADEALAQELCQSTKDLQEQKLVMDDLLERFQEICAEVNPPTPPKVRALRHVQHLWSVIEGKLHEDNTDLDIIKAFHPTPAVGGRPRRLALETLGALEPFDRGWYASPVGWIGPEASEFAVGIRSALFAQEQMVLYVGAGIIPASQAHEEWQELSYKLRPFLHLTQRQEENDEGGQSQ